MGKSLVIVESPAKAKTINKYLGNEYVVKSSIGHIRDLPTSGSASTAKEPVKRGKAAAGEVPALSPKEKAKRQLFARMGVDPEHGWKAKYEILPGKEKVVEELRRLAKDADTIYLATDLDREGEAIAWHLRESIGGDDSRYKRVVFNEITKKAIQEAFSKPGELDINRVNAQQARRFLDRVVGYMVSPLLWAKIARGLSAGRVQSVAVKLVVEREKEIRAFVPEEYWEVHADLGTTKGANVRFEVARENGAAFKPLNEAQAMAALNTLKASSYSISKREDKPTSSKPSAPFITSTLQQAASNRLGFGVKKTMMMAQRLYEAGYITYMRTDSTNLSADAVSMVRDFIQGEFGKKYLPADPIAYSSKEGAQEAHEAIRPSDVNLKPTQLSGMERDAERLYELIWRQFVACQMPPAEYLSTTVTVTAAQFELRAKGRILKFDGYTRALPQMSKPGDDDVLPDMGQGEALKLIKLDPSQHFTKPPARYSEASLVKEMEKRGIGRPSTYAAIIGTIQDRGYVALHNRRFYSEKMGDIVTERLSESFSNLMDYGFTAGMEEHLDDVAQGQREWKNVLDEFYGDFKKKLEVAGDSDGGMRANTPTLTDIACRDCARPMTIRTASTGVFLGCSGYALPPKERCKATVNLVPGDEIAADDEGESESLVLLGKHRCPICSTAMDAYLLDETRKLHICGNNPDCPGYEVEQGQYRIKGYEGPSLDCDKCGSQMQLKTGRFGKFFGCTNSECKNTRKLLKSGEAAPPKMDPVKMPELKCEKVNDTYILRDGASGLFLAASQFPKNRETRAPLVVEIIPHRDEIDPKYHFLCDAPKKDPQGRAAVIRYSRKTKEQYVQTEVDGKPSGWRAFFDGGKWKVEDKNS
ncbi:type I DNA topoisomerase [Pseudomonas leptonychotis]|uniref:DNA topoisomerase 1 n=1 Tax=Pseudomonas leptonychotis TaxID=2448482 RepID=A0A4V4R800_9PSED|nr:type I DNA topoisomerase [Pseudomonas leptonychotis]TIH08614.1 type I DNA topoisomerase [Pseudomonas leptonychotis]